MIKVIGDICVDVTHNCECTRISPEGPFPILRETDDVEYRLGMVGYVTALLASLNEKSIVDMYSSWEDDPGCVPITTLLSDYNNIRVNNIPSKKGIYKHRYYVGPHMVARIDKDCYRKVMLQPGDVSLGEKDILVFSDYQKGVRLHWRNAPRVAQYSIYDPHGSTRLEQMHGYTIITPNASEYSRLTEQADAMECESIVEYFHTHDNIGKPRYVIHTRGEEGVVIETWDNINEEVTKKKILPLGICRGKVVDIVGAGDCIVAGLATGLAAGATVEKALMYGMIVAELAITHKGTAVVSRGEIRKHVSALTSDRLL